MRRFLVLALLLLTPVLARADRREIYTVLSIEPGWFSYGSPPAGTGSAGAFAGNIALGTYYGLTDTLHLGGVIRFGYSKNVAYDSVSVTLSDGVASQGRLFQDHSQLGLGALALYHWETGSRWAPVASVEAGLAHQSFSRIEHVPAGTSYAIPLKDRAETAFYFRPGLALELRLSSRFIFAVGAAVTVSPGSSLPMQVTFPATFGVIW
jgi:hypothetical protein